MTEFTARASDRILVVDDDALLRWSIVEALKEHGHEVTAAGSAREALERSADAALLLTDYQLPDTDGLQLAATVSRVRPGCRLLLMTGFGTPELRRRARDAGVLRVIDKPFPLHALVRAVERALWSEEAGQAAPDESPRGFGKRASRTCRGQPPGHRAASVHAGRRHRD